MGTTHTGQPWRHAAGGHQLTTEGETVSTNMKLKIIGLATAVALFALPAADAFAGHYG
jgi:hypothetical protein